MKTIIRLTGLLLAVLLFLPLSLSALAEGEETPPLYWEDAVKKFPAGFMEDHLGNVTVSTAEGLAWLISCVNGKNGASPDSFEGKTVTLEKSLDLSAYFWTPVGTEKNPFKGSFNGAGFTLSGLRFRTEDSGGNPGGLFGKTVNANISHLTVRAYEFYFRSEKEAIPLHVGGIVGHAENSVIVNTSFHGDITAAISAESDHNVGLICGLAKNSRIHNSFAVGSVTCSGLARICVGGVAAQLDGSEIIGSFCSASLSAISPDTADIFMAACVGRVFNQSAINSCYYDSSATFRLNHNDKVINRGVDESLGNNGQSIGKFNADLILTPTDNTLLTYGDALVSALNMLSDTHPEFAPWSDDGHLPILVYIDGVAPGIIRQPGDISVTLGKVSGKLEVRVREETGCRYSYRWYVDGKLIPTATSRVFYLPSDLDYQNEGKHTAFCAVTSYMQSSGKTAETLSDIANIRVICVDHVLDEGSIIKEAASGVEGASLHHCTVCGAEEVVIIPAKPQKLRIWLYFIGGLSLAVFSAFLYTRRNKNSPAK